MLLLIIIIELKSVKKTNKKIDKELFLIIEEKIKQGNYVFLQHAKQRLKERHITELDVIYLLSGKKGYERKRNKRKDIYESFSLTDKPQDWKYCIEQKACAIPFLSEAGQASPRPLAEIFFD